MATKTLEGADAMAALEELAKNGSVNNVAQENEPVEAVKFELRPVVLPPGYRFNDLRMKHMIGYGGEVDFKLYFKLDIQLHQYHIHAAIKAGWFSEPLVFDTDMADNLSCETGEMLYEAIMSEWINRRNTPKN